jgi:hypothetical protein
VSDKARSPIIYSAFWDFPRTFVCAVSDRKYLFDCRFDEDLDDFDSHYDVYQVPEAQWPLVEHPPWTDLLADPGERLGRVPVGAVRFGGRPFEWADVTNALELLAVGGGQQAVE